LALIAHWHHTAERQTDLRRDIQIEKRSYRLREGVTDQGKAMQIEGRGYRL